MSNADEHCITGIEIDLDNDEVHVYTSRYATSPSHSVPLSYLYKRGDGVASYERFVRTLEAQAADGDEDATQRLAQIKEADSE